MVFGIIFDIRSEALTVDGVEADEREGRAGQTAKLYQNRHKNINQNVCQV
jgi:hypothetical protein